MALVDEIACVEREVKMRLRVYPRWVSMSPQKAEQETAQMRAVLDRLKALNEGGNLL